MSAQGRCQAADLVYMPDDIKDGIYHRVNFPDGRFIAIRPMYFSAWIMIGINHETTCDIVREYAVGTNDTLIFRYYHLLLFLLCNEVPPATFPLPQKKVAVEDKEWVKSFADFFHQHTVPSRRMQWAPLTTFYQMHMQTLRPLINNAKRSLHESRKK